MDFSKGKTKLKELGKKVVSNGVFKLFIWCLILVYIIESAGRHSIFGGLQFLIDEPFR